MCDCQECQACVDVIIECDFESTLMDMLCVQRDAKRGAAACHLLVLTCTKLSNGNQSSCCCSGCCRRQSNNDIHTQLQVHPGTRCCQPLLPA